DEGAAMFRAQQQRLLRKRISRQMMVRGSTVLALGGATGLAQFIAACSGDSKSENTTSSSSSGTSGGGSGTATSSSFKDTTSTPPYKMGKADASAPDALQKYPYVYKYNFRRHNYAAPVAIGGQLVRGYGPFPDWDFLKNVGGPIGQAFMNGLYHH